MPASFVQKAGAAGAYVSGSGSLAPAFGAPVGSGNAVMGFAGGYSSSISSVTDDQSNSYTVTSQLASGSGGMNIFGFYALNLTNAPQTITVTFDGTTFAAYAVIHEASGIATASAADGAVGAVSNGVGEAADAISSTAITATADGDYIIGLTANATFNGHNPAAGTGFTSRQAGGDGSGATGFKSEDQVQSTQGSIAATFTHNAGNGGEDVVTAIMAFKAAAGGGGGGAAGVAGEMVGAPNGHVGLIV